MENMKEKLLKLMNEYPTYEVKFIISEDLYSDDSNTTICDIAYISIDALAKYTDEELLDYDDYFEKLCDYYADEYEDDEHLEEFVENKMKDVKFTKYILVWLGN